MYRLAASLMLFACLSLVPDRASAAPGIGVGWDANFSILQIGDFGPDAGLECIGLSSTAEVGVYRLLDGTRITVFPSPFSNPYTQHHLVQADADTEPEFLSINSRTGYEVVVGLLNLDQAKFTRVWPDLVLGMGSSWLGFFEYNAANYPGLLFRQAGDLELYALETGQLIYDSGDSQEIPGAYSLISYHVFDIDDDGRQELLAQFGDGGFENKTVLIEDASPVTAVGPGTPAPALILSRSFPNPTRGASSIQFTSDRPGPARLRLFDASGRLVRTLLEGTVTAGTHTETWDGVTDTGARAAGGVYFYELEMNGVRGTRKLVRTAGR